MESSNLQASVVIACHTEDRWDHVLASVDSVIQQHPPADAIIISVDHAPNLYKRLTGIFPRVTVVENRFQRGASGNRNSGALATNTPFIAFLDDDARARPGWLARLIKPLEDPKVVGTGGFVAPAWSSRKPRWFPDEFAWTVGVSHSGLPTTQVSVRNVWSENMAVRRDVFHQVGGFRPDFNKVGHISRPEDTDLCIRMGKWRDESSWIFVPDAIVDHHVGDERTQIKYFLRRCFLEGRGKVELARINDGSIDLPDERIYLRRTIPRGIARGIRDGLSSKEIDHFYRVGAMVGGVAAAGAGALASFANRRQFLNVQPVVQPEVLPIEQQPPYDERLHP
jgi:glucosyl-dolichyl phosphate glucuronosyltransferase